MWNLTDFENAAKKMAQAFVASDGGDTINDQAVKVASEAGLNPNEVATLVRLANVCVFEGMMAKAAETGAADRMIEFDTGDPDAVLAELHGSAKVASAQKDGPRYDQFLDYFTQVDAPVERVVEGQELSYQKEASAEEPPALTPDEWEKIRVRTAQAMEKLSENVNQTRMEWLISMEKAAQSYRVSGVSRAEFEKDAAAIHGAVVEPELRMLRKLTGGEPYAELYGGEKLATVLATHVPHPDVVRPILGAVKEAQEAREKMHKYEAGKEKLTQIFS